MPGGRLAAALVGVLLAVLAPASAWARPVALVIGNAAYSASPPLANPGNDARGVARALRDAGFSVAEHVNLDKAGMDRALRQFAKALRGAEVALFYYAGHGLAVEGENYLVPIDARLDDPSDLDFETLALNVVVRMLEGEPRTSLIFLDACRDNPLARSLARGLGASRSSAVQRGLTPTSAGIGTLIAYATQPGYVAADGNGRHSPFTEAVLRHIGTPGLEVRQLLTRVRNDVLKATDRRQQPWDHSSLTGDFYFRAAAPTRLDGGGEAAVAAAATREETFWRGVADSRRREDFEAYLDRYPNGVFSELAQRRLRALATATAPAGPGVGGRPGPSSTPPAEASPEPAGSSPGERASRSEETVDASEFEVFRHEE